MPKLLFEKGEECVTFLEKNPEKKKYRHNWLNCIEKFQAVTRHDPQGSWAAAGLYKTGELFGQLYRYSGKESDRQEALDIYQRIVLRYPKSRYKSMAAAEKQKLTPQGSVALRQQPSPTKTHAKGEGIPEPSAEMASTDMLPTVETGKRPPSTSLANVQGLRHWSNPRYTRIVIDTDNPTEYSHRLLAKDPELQKPQRLFIDLKQARLGESIPKKVAIEDKLLIDARAGQYLPDVVRVVVDIKSYDTYKVFDLRNPFRIVVDVWGDTETSHSEPLVARTIPRNQKIDKNDLVRQLGLGVRRIVIDPGHGGKDHGAPGYLGGVHEKTVVLAIGKKLAKMIREKLGCDVVMTRDGDRYLTLEERTAIANTKEADLFISIHTNASVDKRAHGIETFFLNFATDDEAIRVAALENATSTKNISDLQTILNDLMKNTKINESSRLAGYVQGSLYRDLKIQYTGIKNKGVKQAPFYVLIGAQMPSILIETSFISNPLECKRLTDPKYQDHLCKAIVKGIKNYIIETSPTAFRENNAGKGPEG
jgi:N-acetylmuramoyl-L-alanine amidase